ncbi:erythromycin esterase family protein [Neobacillus sp. D3-1R]|uniref:erythromycin esterase family protein n=1 Tax=Neobacillus sp. D3-1R TaxID=3445778 RepID=UPI003F9EBE13
MDYEKRMIASIKNEAISFETNRDFDQLIEAIGDRQFVLLGEASHGTSEFYQIRMELSKRLITEKGFSVIAVEGDWPSCFTVNEYIKGFKGQSALDAVKDFNRWPTWMWANEEILSLIDWMKTYNSIFHNKVGFYGIDVYSLWESMEALVKNLETSGTGDVEKAKKAFSCFEPFYRRPENYGISAAFYGEHCQNEVSDLLATLRKNHYQYEKGHEESLNIQVNGLVTQNAEKYYKAMVRGGPDDWNIRDHHMVSAIDEIVSFYGTETKVIVWEHNTHIGDARATDMIREGLVNVGQIMRQKYGHENVYAVGFGTHRGTVMAANRWGEEMQVMSVPMAIDGSWEDLMHRAGPFNKYLLFNPQNETSFRKEIGHRAIGVVYNPEYEHLGNYVTSIMSERYNAFFYIDETKALSPLKTEILHV